MKKTPKSSNEAKYMNLKLWEARLGIARHCISVAIQLLPFALIYLPVLADWSGWHG